MFSELLERALDEQFERSPAFREFARHLATMTLDRLREFDAGAKDHPQGHQPEPEDSPPAPAVQPQNPGQQAGEKPAVGPAVEPIVGPSAVVPLRIGDAWVDVPVRGPEHAIDAARASAEAPQRRDGDETDYLERTARARAIDLDRVSVRCTLKAEACRHQILRQGQDHDTTEEFASREVMNGMIARAKAIPDCFLWMFYRKGAPTSEDQLELIARCYEAMADAARLCHELEPIDLWPDEEQVREALQMLSTTSSALRVSLTQTWLTQPDIDQDEVHHWLKLVTAEHRYHVRKHMQLSDPADPRTDAPAASERARAVLAELRDRRGRREKAERLLKKGLYHAQKVHDALQSPFDEGTLDHDFAKINEAMAAIAALRPDDAEAMARQLARLAPPDSFPEALPPHEALTAAVASNDKPRAKEAPAAEAQGRTWSDDVLRVRELIGGGQIVVVGGEPRRDAMERMIDAFGLDEVVWPELSEHGPAEPMRAPIANPSTRLVVVLIKLTGHEHAERAREFAKQASVPFVHMPAGYNPEQIAAEVLRQASAQLRSA